MQQFSRPQAAREIEARARAKALGVHVEQVEMGSHYRTRSQSEPGTTYDLYRTPVGFTCSCKGFVYTGVCKHLGQLERRLEREGMSYGFRIAPRPQIVA
jgi:hypothetical protein